MHLDLIVGLALDYFEDIRYSFEEVFKLFAPELQLGFLKFLKGTPVRDKHQQHGFVFDKNPPYQIIESNYLSRQELQKIVLLEHALEIYWNKKRCIHALKYVTQHYSIFDFLLGLGTYFTGIRDVHQYTLKDVYEIVYQYAQLNFPDDNILHELIAIDYYRQYKIKPQQLFIQEISSEERTNYPSLIFESSEKTDSSCCLISFDFTVCAKEVKVEYKNGFPEIINISIQCS